MTKFQKSQSKKLNLNLVYKRNQKKQKKKHKKPNHHKVSNPQLYQISIFLFSHTILTQLFFSNINTRKNPALRNRDNLRRTRAIRPPKEKLQGNVRLQEIPGIQSRKEEDISLSGTRFKANSVWFNLVKHNPRRIRNK